MKTHAIFGMLITLWMTASLTTYGQGLKTLEELTKSAPVIVTGTVMDVQAEPGEYLGREDFIFTYVTVAVQTALKGTEEEQIKIKVPGGKIGDRVIAGERNFSFSKGEEVLLFLSPIAQNQYEIYSISGKLSMESGGNRVNTTLLRKDEVSDYGYQSRAQTEDILSRINQYLTDAGGNRQ